jgi:hypothetical protein
VLRVVEQGLDLPHGRHHVLLLLGQLGGVDLAVGDGGREVLELAYVGVEVRSGVVVDPAGAGHGPNVPAAPAGIISGPPGSA